MGGGPLRGPNLDRRARPAIRCRNSVPFGGNMVILCRSGNNEHIFTPE